MVIAKGFGIVIFSPIGGGMVDGIPHMTFQLVQVPLVVILWKQSNLMNEPIMDIALDAFE